MKLATRTLVSGWFAVLVIASGIGALVLVSHRSQAATFFQDSFDPAPLPGWSVSGSGWHAADDGVDPCFGNASANHPANSASSPNSFAYHFDTAPPALPGSECTYAMDNGAGGSAPNSGTLTSPTIALTNSGPAAWLHFRTWRQTEGNPAFDQMTISLSVGGGPFLQVFQLLDPPTPQTAWETIDVDISAAAGFSAVTILFRFNTVDDRTNTFAGWYVDDVSVTGPGFDLLPDSISGDGTAGSTRVYPFSVRNLQTSSDTFDLTASGTLGWTVQFWNAANTAVLTDTGGSADPDTGPVGAGATFNFNVRVLIPGGANLWDVETSTVTATSVANATEADASSIATRVIPPPVSPPWFDDMELGPNPWNHSSTGGVDEWQWGTPTYGPPTCFSGAACWGTDLSGPYNNGFDASLYPPRFNLTSATRPELTFRHWYHIYGDSPPSSADDGGFLEITTNGGLSWNQLFPTSGALYNETLDASAPYNVCFGQQSGGWVTSSVDLSSFVGGIVQVRFRLWDDTPGPNTAGWYIDDVRLREPALSLLPASVTGTGTAGSTRTYAFSVQNLQTTGDTFDLTASGVLGWTVEFWNAANTAILTDTGGSPAPDTGPVGSGATFNFNVRVLIPAAATPGTVETTTIVATSVANATESDTSTATTTVTPSLNLIPASATSAAVPGSAHFYPFSVQNLQTTSDTFDLTASGILGWTVEFWNAANTALLSDTGGSAAPDTGAVGAGLTFSFNIHVRVPAAAVPGDVETSTITATSVANPASTDVSTLSTYAAHTVPFLDAFDPSPRTGWTTSDNGAGTIWEWGTTSWGPGGCYSSPSCWGTNLNSDYTNNALVDLITPAVILPSGGASTLTFRHWYRTEFCCDLATVSASSDRTTWSSLAQYRGTSGAWSAPQFDLSAYSGGPVFIRFRLTTDGSITYAGWYLDDFSITVRALDLFPASRFGTGTAGSARSYAFSIQNLQTTSDTFDLTASGVLGWSVEFWNAANTAMLTDTGGSPAPDTGPVGAGSTFSFNIHVLIPGSASPGTVETSTITAASAANATNVDTSTATTTVSPSLNLFPTSATGAGPPGFSQVYPFSVQNLQATSDNFDLTASGVLGWTVQFWNAADTTMLTDTGGSPAPDTGPVGSGTTFSFNIRVLIPAAATPGDVETSTINATSVANPASTDSSSITTRAIPPPVSPPWFDDMESGPSPWTTSPATGIDEWEWGSPSVVGPAACYSGAACWGTDINGTYDVGFDASLYPPPFDLTTSNQANLSFRHWYHIYGDSPPSSVDDGGFLEISTNGGQTWSQLFPTSGALYNETLDGSAPYNECFGQQSNGWVTSTVDLSAYVGGIVQVRFRLWDDTSVGPNTAGWYIDDVRLEQASASGDRLVATVTSLAPAVAGTDQLTAIMRIDLDNDAAQDGVVQVSAFSVHLTGCSGVGCASAPLDTDVRGVFLVQDRGDGAYDGLDPLLGFATFTGGYLLFTLSAPLSVNATTGERLFVVYWISAGAVVGDYVGASFGPSDVTVELPDAAGSFAGLDTYLPNTRTRIAAVNTRPIANAGADQTVSKKTLVTLSGIASSDPDNDSISFAWTAPGGITLSASNVASPTFTPARGGSYTFTLTVSDARGGVAIDTATVVVTNAPPTADAGANQTVDSGIQVSLDAGASSDPTNDVLSYAWSAPAGITLSSVTSATPTFTARSGGTFTLTLTVTDEEGVTDTDTVTITVRGGGGLVLLSDFGWLLIVLLVFAAAFSLGLFVGIRRQRRPREELPPSPPSPPAEQVVPPQEFGPVASPQEAPAAETEEPAAPAPIAPEEEEPLPESPPPEETSPPPEEPN